MPNQKFILRTLQVATVIAVTGLAVLALTVFDVVPFASILQGDKGQIADKKKVPRPKKQIASNEFLEAMEQGNETLKAQDFTKALEIFQKASVLDPRESKPYERIGDVFFAQRNYISARQNYELAKNLNPQSTELPLKLGRTFLGLRKIIEAKIEFEKILPESYESLYYRGLIAAFLNDQESAKTLLTKSLSSGSDEELQNNAQSILSAYREFELARDSKIEFLQGMLAQIFDRIGEFGLAIELSFNALKTHPDYRDVWIVLGHAYLSEGKAQDGEDALTKALELDSSHPAAYFYRGLARKELLKTDAALEDFESALKLGFKPQILVKQELADSYFAKKNFAFAFPLYREIVLTDSSQIDRFIRPMALAINHLGKPLDALELAKKAFEAHPDTAMAYNLMGWALLAQNDFEGARQNLSEALRLDPELAATYLNLGLLNERTGNLSEAVSAFQKALELSERSGDSSIRDAAQKKFEKLQTEPTNSNSQFPIESKNVPQIQYIPSLSLQ